MLTLSHWAQGILTVQPVDAKTLQGLDWPYLIHLVLGMTIFLIFPFSRLVHIWSAPSGILAAKAISLCAHARRLTVRGRPVPRRRRSERHERGPPRLRLHGQTRDRRKAKDDQRQWRRNLPRGYRAGDAEPSCQQADRGLAGGSARARGAGIVTAGGTRRIAPNHNRSATRMGDAKPRRRRWCAASSHAKL